MSEEKITYDIEETITYDSRDPWKHRSAGMRCRTCIFFVPKAPTPNFGRCRRHAPTMSGYPAVFDTDWCGDHKLDENAIEPPSNPNYDRGVLAAALAKVAKTPRIEFP